MKSYDYYTNEEIIDTQYIKKQKEYTPIRQFYATVGFLVIVGIILGIITSLFF